MNLFKKKELVEDEFVESEHPRAKNGQFTNKGGEGSGRKEERGTYENFKSPIANKIGNWYGEQGEESADKARAMREMEWTLHKLNTEKNDEEKEELKRDIDWEMKKFEERFGEKPEKYGFKYEKESDVSGSKEDDWQEQAKKADKGYTIAHKDKDGNNTVIAEVHKEDISEESPKKSQFNWKNDGLGKHLTLTRGNSKVVLRESGEVRSYMNGKLMPLLNDKVEDVEEYAKHQIELGYKLANDEAIPDEQDKPETAGEEKADIKEEKMDKEEKKESVAEVKKEEVVEDKAVDKRKLIDEIGGILKGKVDDELIRTIIKKAEEIAYNGSEAGKADDEVKAEVKEEEKKEEIAKDKCAKDECKDKMAKDEMTFDIDSIKAQVREEVMQDFKARDEARKSVKGTLGEINVMAFDSCADIYKMACEKAGLNVSEIANYKDAFIGFSAGSKANKSTLALDAAPKSGSNVEECLKKNIRI